MKKFALIALPFALAACSQTEETVVEPTATETAVVEPMPADTMAPVATDTAAPVDGATPAPTDATATPAATETPM